MESREKEILRVARDRVIQSKLHNVTTIGGSKSKLKAANDVIEWMKTAEGQAAVNEEIERLHT